MYFKPILLHVWIYVTLICHEASNVPFTRDIGTLDYMNKFGWMEEGLLPLQLVPIYGHECFEKDCQYRRFLTVRLGNEEIIEFSNYWTTMQIQRSDGWGIRCPENRLALGLTCTDTTCAVPQLHCGAMLTQFQIIPSKNTIAHRVGNSSRVLCPDGMYVQGFECRDSNCQSMEHFCVAVEFARAARRRLALLPTGNRVMMSEYFHSGLNKGLSPVMSGPIFCVRCGRHSCEEISLLSVSRGEQPLLDSVTFWTDPIGDEGTSVACPPGMLVRQMKCQGEYCKKVFLGCAMIATKSIVQFDETDLKASDVFGSNVPTDGYCPDGYYMKQLTCFRYICSQMVLGCIRASFIEWLRCICPVGRDTSVREKICLSILRLRWLQIFGNRNISMTTEMIILCFR